MLCIFSPVCYNMLLLGLLDHFCLLIGGGTLCDMYLYIVHQHRQLYTKTACPLRQISSIGLYSSFVHVCTWMYYVYYVCVVCVCLPVCVWGGGWGGTAWCTHTPLDRMSCVWVRGKHWWSWWLGRLSKLPVWHWSCEINQAPSVPGTLPLTWPSLHDLGTWLYNYDKLTGYIIYCIYMAQTDFVLKKSNGLCMRICTMSVYICGQDKLNHLDQQIWYLGLSLLSHNLCTYTLDQDSALVLVQFLTGIDVWSGISLWRGYR